MNLNNSNLTNSNAIIHQDAAALYEQTLDSLSPDLVGRYQKMVDWYNESPLLKNAIAVDAHAPDIDLINSEQQPTPIKQLLKNGPVILISFRGDWCTFCNYYMNLISKSLSIFKDAGASFYAVTPQTKFTREDWQDMSTSEFLVMSDPNHQILRKFGLVFEVPEFIQHLMLDLGVDLSDLNGNWELPVTGVYIVGEDGKVAWRDIGKDFRFRTDPAEIIRVLKGEAV